MRFDEWAKTNRHTPRTIAEELAKLSPSGDFSSRTVEKWLYEGTIPGPENMSLIKTLTGGDVTANDFYDAAISTKDTQ